MVATPVTLAVADLLTRDALKIARLEGYTAMFTTADIHSFGARATAVDRHGTFRHRGIEIEFTRPGTFPGPR